MVSPPTSCDPYPPLLHTYTAPSGPIASPFGLPPFSDTTSVLPSDCTRTTVPPRSSTHSTLPSGIHTGPSGKRNPLAISVISMSMAGAKHLLDRSVKAELHGAHEAAPGAVRRAHAPAGVGQELQRVDVLQLLLSRRPHRRVGPPRQPGQRGLRRDDDVRLPPPRGHRGHVQPARDHRQRRVRRRWASIRDDRAVRAATPLVHGQGRAARAAARDGEPAPG